MAYQVEEKHVISNVVFHHDDEGNFDYAVVNTVRHLSKSDTGEVVSQTFQSIEPWDQFSDEEKSVIAQAYQAIKRVIES